MSAVVAGIFPASTPLWPVFVRAHGIVLVVPSLLADNSRPPPLLTPAMWQTMIDDFFVFARTAVHNPIADERRSAVYPNLYFVLDVYPHRLERALGKYYSLFLANFLPLTGDGIFIYRDENGPLDEDIDFMLRLDSLQTTALSAPSVGGEKDIMKLFSDAQQNMLYLNKQRLAALEEVHKLKQDKEAMLAQIARQDVEMSVSLEERNLLSQRLKVLESHKQSQLGYGIAGSVGGNKEEKAPEALVGLWSQYLLKVDQWLLTRVIDAQEASSLRLLPTKNVPRALEALLQHQEESASLMLRLAHVTRRRSLHVVHICTELAPLTGVTPVADFVTGLCKALWRKGQTVEVILPRYGFVGESGVEALQRVPSDFRSFFDGQWHTNHIWTTVVEGIPVTLIEPQHPAGFFSRPEMYNYEDDVERFTYFSRAALDYLVRVSKSPDIIHAHNWHTAAVAPLFWDLYCHQPGFGDTRIVFTCHDFRVQAVHGAAKLGLCGLEPHQLDRPDRLQDNQDPSLVNLLKGGVVYSNKVTTVSTAYVDDLIHCRHDMGATLDIHRNKFVGLPSGVTTLEWDPQTDSSLPALYSPSNTAGKAVAKSELQQQLGFQHKNADGNATPLVGCIVPKVMGADIDFIREALVCSLMQGAQFVFVGGSTDPRVQVMLEELRRDILNGEAELLIQEYDCSMAHIAVAASDILVCPPVQNPFDPFPIVGMRYGALPVVREELRTGKSLVDGAQSTSRESGCFFFNPRLKQSISGAISRAISQLRQHPKQWEELVANAMTRDFTWDANESDNYIEVYWSIRDS
eukprot:jgi/Mesen1/11080/ME000990S10437